VTDTLSLLEAADLIRGVSYKREEASATHEPGLLPVLRANNIQGGRVVLDDLVYVPAHRISLEQKLREGDIVLAMSSGSRDVVGKAALMTGDWEGGFGAFCGVLRVTPRIRADWLAHFLQSAEYRHAIEVVATGTNINNLSKTTLRSVRVPYMPEAMQSRVAGILDLLSASNSSASNHLAAARRATERFRQAVVAAASSGRLTADWRTDEHDCDDVESLVSEATRLRARSVRKAPASPADTADAESCPDTWRVVSLDAITTRITSGSRDWSQYYGSGQGTFVMAQNVRPGLLDWSYRQAVDPPLSDPSRERSQILKGDLLITIVGANTGDVAPVLDDYPEHFVCQSVALARPALTELAGFLNLWFNSEEHGQSYFADCMYGAGRPHLSFNQLRAAPVFLPPLAEQQEIVRRVGELSELAARLLERIDNASRAVHLSSQAVLAKAFRGELVPSSEGEL
jgi:type I restriction enzyme S subunit